MNYRIIVVGDRPAAYHIDAINEYKKRLSRYCRIQCIEIDKPSSGKAHRIAVSTSGKELSSEDLAAKINKLAVSGVSDIDFIIGPRQTGVDEEISMSPMDLSGGMTAVIVFEQIYRAYRILNNEPYHK